MSCAKVLVVDALSEVRQQLDHLLTTMDLAYEFASRQEHKAVAVERFHPDLIIVCTRRSSNREAMRKIKNISRACQSVPIILITAFSSEARAIAALRAGVRDYFKPPISDRSMQKSIEKIISAALPHCMTSNQQPAEPNIIAKKLIGRSPIMQKIQASIARVAPTESTVLITGETGTGKDLTAQLIHRQSFRRTNPFIHVNCAALPDNLIESELFGFERGAFTGAVAKQSGKFILAGGGSIFLDEIGDMNAYAQAKILGSLENKAVFPLGGKKPVPLDVRIIAATNKEPERLIKAGRFREDLYYRLNVARLNLPPLRERKEDIPGLVEHGIDQFNRRFRRNLIGLSDRAMEILMRYDWPGNVRELMNLLEAVYVNLPNRKIIHAELPGHFRQRMLAVDYADIDERHHIVTALMDTNWNKSSAAQQLKWSRMTLYRKMAKYKIVEKRHRRV